MNVASRSSTPGTPANRVAIAAIVAMATFETPLRTLAEALRGADVFVGLSAAGVATPEMIRL